MSLGYEGFFGRVAASARAWTGLFDGERTKLQPSHFKISHSRAFIGRVCPLQTHERLFNPQLRLSGSGRRSLAQDEVSSLSALCRSHRAVRTRFRLGHLIPPGPMLGGRNADPEEKRGPAEDPKPPELKARKRLTSARGIRSTLSAVSGVLDQFGY